MSNTYLKLIESNQEKIAALVKSGVTATNICVNLGIRKLNTLKKYCQLFGIEWVPHPGSRTGQGGHGKKPIITSLDDAILRNSKHRIRKFLIQERGHICEECGNIHWRGHLIPLAVHHIDGDHFNNDRNNLQLLCFNCHALTDNFCAKNIKQKQKATQRKYKLGEQSLLSKAEIERRLSVLQLIDTTKYGWVMKAADSLGVTHAQIRRFVKKYGVNLTVKERKSAKATK